MPPRYRRIVECDSDVRHWRRREIESNNPALSDLSVGSHGFCPPDGDWRRDGEGIGGNTRLESLAVSHFEDEDDPGDGIAAVSEGAIREFFRGVANNRSIVDLALDHCDFAGAILDSLTPFFENNPNLRILDVSGVGARDINSLDVSLNKNTSLESIAIRSPDYEDRNVDEAMKNLCKTLAAHSSLTKLHLDGINLGRAGGDALLPLLQSTNSNSIELYLECNHTDDEGMAEVSRGLENCTVLQKLTINMREEGLVSIAGWQSFAACLNGPTCRLEELVFYRANLDDVSAIALTRTLGNNTHLKSLDISHHRDITISGWRAFAALLQSPHSQLRELILDGCGINNEATLALANSLNNNNSLKRLFLDDSRIDVSGWQALTNLLSRPQSKLECLSLQHCGISSCVALPLARAFSNRRLKALWLSANLSFRAILSALARPDSVLEELYLSNCAITDEAVIDLANSLNINNKLRVLDLSFNPRITITTWRTIAASLQNPHSALEKLDLRNNSIKDDVAITFANSLANNSKLKELNFDYNREITKAAWHSFSQVLCNQTSILDTYNSNHTLHALHPYPTLYNFILNYQKMNQNENKSDVARQKIIKHHFANGISIEPFVDMELKLLPHAVAWMAKKVTDINDGGKSLLFSFLPFLIEHMAGQVIDSNACG